MGNDDIVIPSSKKLDLRKIENCKTWESIINTIGINLKPFENILQKKVGCLYV